MRLTAFGRLFLTLVALGILGFVAYQKFGPELRAWSSGAQPLGGPSGAAPEKRQPGGSSNEVTKDDFRKVSVGFDDAARDSAIGKGTQAKELDNGTLNRPLRVGINTWAGHSPGLVANGGLRTAAGSIYQKRYGIEVEFKLIEDPSAKLAAFISGDIDVMWDTVDSFAREASLLKEKSIPAKAFIQQDWSRGGDGIVALSSINSIEDLKGKRIASTRYTPSHWLLLFLLSQSGLTNEERASVERDIIFTDEAPQAAAMFKAGKVDAAVTWEPDLSGAVAARGSDAHILVSTTAATHVIADILVARQAVIDRAGKTMKAFVAGWLDGISVMKEDPQGTNQLIGRTLKLTPDDVSGMLSGLKLTPFADNALFFGIGTDAAHPYFETLFDGAFVIWRKKGAVTAVVDAADYADSRFIAALAQNYAGQKVEESFAFKDKPKLTDRAIVKKRLSIHFSTNSDEVMPGSFFTLDSLGETMLAFGNTYLEVEGNTDSRGSEQANQELSKKRAEAVRNYLITNFKIDPKRLVAQGRGSKNPVATNATEDGRALNRRTDIKVILNAQ